MRAKEAAKRHHLTKGKDAKEADDLARELVAELQPQLEHLAEQLVGQLHIRILDKLRDRLVREDDEAGR